MQLADHRRIPIELFCQRFRFIQRLPIKIEALLLNLGEHMSYFFRTLPRLGDIHCKAFAERNVLVLVPFFSGCFIVPIV